MVSKVFCGLGDNLNSRGRRLILNPAGMTLLEATLSSLASNKDNVHMGHKSRLLRFYGSCVTTTDTRDLTWHSVLEKQVSECLLCGEYY